MNFPTELVIMPLRSAVLCVDCSSVSNTPSPFCPACGSPSLLNAAALLDREDRLETFLDLEAASA